MAGGVVLGAAVLAAFLAAPVGAVVVTGNGAWLSATADVTASRIPPTGPVPMTVRVSGRVGLPSGFTGPIRSLGIELSVPLRVGLGGLEPICTIADLTSGPGTPHQARKRCGAALIGSGQVTEQFPKQPGSPSVAEPVLIFNSTAKPNPSYLVYSYLPPGPASRHGSVLISKDFATGGRVIGLAFPDSQTGGVTTAFRFRFGRVWSEGGKLGSFISGTCPLEVLAVKTTVGIEHPVGSLSAEETIPC